MIKPIKLTLIDNYSDLLLTHEVLKRNMEELEHGKRLINFLKGMTTMKKL